MPNQTSKGREMSEKTRSFLIRLRSSVIVMALVALGLVPGGICLAMLLCIGALIGYFEYCNACELWKTGFSAVGILGVLSVLAATFFGNDFWLLLALVFSLILFLFLYVFTYPRYHISQVAEAFFGILYIPLMLGYIYRVREMAFGSVLVWLIFVGSWGSDTMAYVTGLLFGKHKMTPVLSPKKTWEGALGGVLGAALIGFVYALIFRSKLLLFPHPLLDTALIGGFCSVLSQLGDLAASAIKRDKELKDYGNLIPGHGGILDRFDSVIVAAPLIFYLVNYLSK